MNTQNDSISELKDNVVFQLSLSSKELFHSNFLYWLATEKTSLFNNVLSELGIHFQLNLNEHKVYREYEHFDFCICDLDKKILFVLENKFKSIATKKQLDQYKSKIDQINKNKTQPIYILLTLAEDFPDKTKIIEQAQWEVKTYAQYAKALKGQNDTNDFNTQLIQKYQKFIECFSEYFNKKLNNNNLEWSTLNCQELIDLRVNDIWQKLVVSKFLTAYLEDCAMKDPLEDMAKKQDLQNSYKGLYYGTSGASICIHVPFSYNKNQYFYHISIDSTQYRRGIQGEKNVMEEKIKELVKNDNSPFAFSDKASVWEEESKMRKEFNQFGGTYPYYYRYRRMKPTATLHVIASAIQQDVENFRDWYKRSIH